MPEAGGPTTQSGITYQDSIAALFLGRLCDMQARSLHDSILDVRVEAPEYVDDIVITYSDRHTEFIQVKENVKKQDDSWNKMWNDLVIQRNQESFRETDRLVLIFGNYNRNYSDLQEMVLRANGSLSATEWLGRLTIDHTKLLENIMSTHPSIVNNSDFMFKLFQSLKIEIIPYSHIERDYVPYWIPSSNHPKSSLFKLLCSLAGHNARNRRLFTTVQLLSELEEEYNFLIEDPEVFGTKLYIETVKKNYGYIGIPCTPFYGPIEQLFVWPKLRRFDPKYARPLGNLEDPHHVANTSNESIIMINDFPNAQLHQAIVIASAGFGKTTLLYALIHKLTSTNRIPVFIGLIDFASSQQSVVDYLSSTVNRIYSVQVPWEDYCDKGRVVLFFDGLDELTPGDVKSVLSSITIFSNRFPQASWLLTVRDIGAVTSPLPVDRVVLQALDHEEMRQFCQVYGTLHGDIDASDFLIQISNHNDLKALACIPLFLSLMISTYVHHSELPKTRAELLEHYISIIFHPEEYKNSIVLTHDSITIRKIAELLSYNALEEGRIGFSERELDNILQAVPKINPGLIVQDLRLCGILQKNTFTMNFFFPTVQEYLASCYVLDNLSIQEVIEKFQFLSNRPWAQTLQFALEKHRDAQMIISVLLESPDDAFDSLKIVLGRCIANGSLVSNELRQKVGELLTKVWFEHPLELSQKIGFILRDGFTSPLPPLLKSLLEQGIGLTIGGSEIIEACQDDQIALKAVKSILDSPSDSWYRIHWVSRANRNIANQILEIYAENCQIKPSSASPLSSLGRDNLQPERYKIITDNPNIPPHIRLAAYAHIGPLPIPEAVHQILKVILHADMTEEKDLREFVVETALSLILATADPEESFMYYFYIVPDEIKLQMLTILRDWKEFTSDQKIAMLRATEDKCHSSQLSHANKLCQAFLSLPNDTILKDIPLDSMSESNLMNWFYIASRIKCLEPLATGIQHLYTMSLSAEMKMQISDELSRLMRADIFFDGPGSIYYESCAPHPAEMEFQCLLKHWEAETAEVDDETSFYMTTQLSNLGDLKARGRLVQYLNTHLLSMVNRVNEDYSFNITVSHYLNTLEENYVLLDLDLLDAFIRAGSGNAARVALIMLLKYENKHALQRALLLLNDDIEEDRQGYLSNQVRILASRLGVKVVKQEDRYVLVD